MMSDIQSPPLPPIIFKQAAKFRPWLQLSRGEVGAHYKWPPLPSPTYSKEGNYIPEQTWASTDLGPETHTYTKACIYRRVCRQAFPVFSIQKHTCMQVCDKLSIMTSYVHKGAHTTHTQ